MLLHRENQKVSNFFAVFFREEGELDEDQQNIPEPEEDSNKMQERRQEFDRVAEKLKGAIRQKDKSWLDNLVANNSNASKRILLTKLMEENHQHISRELAAIRFSGRCLVQENNDNAQQIDLIDDALAIEETVDFKDLPDDLFFQIEDFIKKEFEVEDDTNDSSDEIEEVPVPPKAPVPLVTLDENDDEDQIEKPDPVESLRRIVKEEKDLYKELQDLEEQRESVLQRIFHLQELRCEILDC